MYGNNQFWGEGVIKYNKQFIAVTLNLKKKKKSSV